MATDNNFPSQALRVFYSHSISFVSRLRGVIVDIEGGEFILALPLLLLLCSALEFSVNRGG